MKKLQLLFAISFAVVINANAQWTVNYQNSGMSLNDIYCTDANTCYAVGLNSTIIKTTDGVNWNMKNSGVSGHLSGIFCTDSNTCYAAADDKNIYKTIDGGNSWQAKNLPNNGAYKPFFVNVSIGYAIASKDVLKTIDAGDTWSIATSVSGQLSLGPVYFTDVNTGYSCGSVVVTIIPFKSGGVIYKTTDGGSNWNEIFKDTTFSGFNDIFFINDSVGYTVGSSGKIFKTFTAGNNWSEVNNPSLGAYYSVYFLNEQKGYVVGTKGTIIKTMDGGLNWLNETDTTITQDLLRGVYISGNIGYISGVVVVLKNNNTGFCNLSKPIISQSSDTLICNSNSMAYQWYLNGTILASATNQTYIAAQNGFYQVKITDADDCSSISDSLNVTGVGFKNLNKQFEAGNIFPNPCSSFFTLQILNNDLLNANLKLVIYDLLGKQVKETLVKNNQTKINRDNLQDGIYFYQLKKDNQNVAIGKLIIQ